MAIRNIINGIRLDLENLPQCGTTLLYLYIVPMFLCVCLRKLTFFNWLLTCFIWFWVSQGFPIYIYTCIVEKIYWGSKTTPHHRYFNRQIISVSLKFYTELKSAYNKSKRKEIQIFIICHFFECFWSEWFYTPLLKTFKLTHNSWLIKTLPHEGI